MVDRLGTQIFEAMRGASSSQHKMSSKFSLQAPYVVASLPRPIDRSRGRYVVGEVFGAAHGSKKRKRSELVVGVDGEGVNLYDVGFRMKPFGRMI